MYVLLSYVVAKQIFLSYDASKGMESLETVWVSRANALQRKGRAVRVTSGICFHLFTKNRFEHHSREQPLPGIYSSNELTVFIIIQKFVICHLV